MTFSLRNLVFLGNARLGTVSLATLTIAANDNPFGLFSFFPENVIYVEELQKLVKITVVRNGGTYGNVAVDFTTEPNTALSDIGNQTMFGVEFSFMIDDVIAFHSFDMLGEQFIILSTQENTKLFVWRGTFVYILVSFSFIKCSLLFYILVSFSFIKCSLLFYILVSFSFIKCNLLF